MIYGLILTTTIGIISFILSKFIPIGAVSIAIVLGILFSNIIKIKTYFYKGIYFSEKTLLSISIALMGFNLDFTILKALGIKSIILIISGILTTLIISLLLSKKIKLNKKYALTLGIGNAICGSSAIASTKDILKAKDEQVGISIAIVNFLGTIGIFIVPLLATLFLNKNIEYGLLIGNTLQAVGQVVAGGFSINENVGEISIIVKMGRILMLTPLIIILIIIFREKKYTSNISKYSLLKNIPLFIILFTVFSIITTLKILPKEIINIFSKTGSYTLIIAMVGIGLKISFKNILKDGKTALIVGSLIFLFQIIFNLIMIKSLNF